MISPTLLFLLNLKDKPEPLGQLTSISFPVLSGWEEDLKRKGWISEMTKRVTKLEEDVRKLKSGI